jgi:hypothetical protein
VKHLTLHVFAQLSQEITDYHKVVSHWRQGSIDSGMPRRLDPISEQRVLKQPLTNTLHGRVAFDQSHTRELGEFQTGRPKCGGGTRAKIKQRLHAETSTSFAKLVKDSPDGCERRRHPGSGIGKSGQIVKLRRNGSPIPIRDRKPHRCRTQIANRDADRRGVDSLSEFQRE